MSRRCPWCVGAYDGPVHRRGCWSCRKKPMAWHLRQRIERLLAQATDSDANRRRLARYMRLNWRLPYRLTAAHERRDGCVPYDRKDTPDPRRDDPGSAKRMRVIVRDVKAPGCQMPNALVPCSRYLRRVQVTRTGLDVTVCTAHWVAARRMLFGELRRRFPETTFREGGN